MSVQRRYTSADLDSLPDVEGVRYEIIEGELFVSKQPKLEHQYVCIELGGALHIWCKTIGHGRAYGTPGLVWIGEDRLRIGRDASGHITVGPELAIEVLSPGSTNARRDRQAKLGLYSRRGVDEYWILDWQRHVVDIFRRQGSALQLAATLGDDDVLTSPQLPGFEIAVSTLWEPEL
ncbi:MAG: Uma2 family endonuclease [Chloroflexota bacterium]